MNDDEIDKLLHTPGCRDKYDLRFTADGLVCLWHEYVPGCYAEGRTLLEAATKLQPMIRAWHARLEAARKPEGT